MPRRASFHLPAIEDLVSQLRYAPDDARHRLMDAAETLTADIDPEQVYPIEFIVFRLTGFRPEGDAPPQAFDGVDVIADLVNVVNRLSAELKLPPDHAGRTAVRIDDVATRLGVAERTVRRYRHDGLVCHMIAFDDGPRLACFEDAIEAFRTRHAERLSRARQFTRIDGDTQSELIEEARALHASGLGLTAIANELSKRTGRARETIRGMLRAHDASSTEPIFGEKTERLAARDARRIERAWWWGISLGAIARRYGRTTAACQRIVNVRRADRLRALQLEHVTLPTFDLVEAEDVILAAPAVTSGLDVAPIDDAISLIDEMRGATVDETAVDALVAGRNWLIRRAQATRDALTSWPTSDALDAIETDLRWVRLLEIRLTRIAAPVVIRTIERALHRPLDGLPPGEIVMLLERGFAIAGEVARTLDPSRGHHLDRRCTLELDLALAKMDLERTTGRASARRDDAVAIDDPTLYTAWPWLVLPRAWAERLDTLGDAAKTLRAHHGLDGARPRSIAELAVDAGSTPSAIARRLRSTIVTLRRTGTRTP